MMPLRCDICLGREGKIQLSNRLPPLLKKHLGVIACGPVRWCESCSKLLEMWDNFSLTARRNLALSHHSIIAVNGISGRRDNHLKNEDIVEVVDLDEDDEGDKENEVKEKEISDLILLDDSETSDLDNTEEKPVQQEDSCDSFGQDEPEPEKTHTEQETVTLEDTRPASCTSPQQPDSQGNRIPIIQDVYSISSRETHVEPVTEQPTEQDDRYSEDEQPMEHDNVSTTDEQPMEQEDSPISSPEQPIEDTLIEQPMKQAYVPIISLNQPIEQEGDCEPDETGYAISEDEEEELLRSPQENVDEPTEPTDEPTPSIREEQPGWPTTLFEPQCIDVPSDPLGLDPLGIKTEPVDDDLLEQPMILNHCTKCKRKFTNMDALALHFKYRHGLLLNKEMQCTRISIKKQYKYNLTLKSLQRLALKTPQQLAPKLLRRSALKPLQRLAPKVLQQYTIQKEFPIL
ncbi:hypothetical protein B566_EDAN015674 [Ephemera danica]|nr:hypothetical protein B566_EDAN015674 [Ephemera danica]